MPDSFKAQKRIYDLCSFDTLYDLESTELGQVFRDYVETMAADKHLTPENTDGKEERFRNLTNYKPFPLFKIRVAIKELVRVNAGG